MSLIKCPECQKEISDKAEKCISCGYPIKELDFIVRFKTPTLPKTIVNVNFIFYNNTTKEVLAHAQQGEIVSLKIEKPIIIRIHIGRGFKDAILEYKPHPNAKYCILEKNTILKPKLLIQEVDFFDSDN
jgi:hypothetical protein|nr:MAG TPA: PROTEIN/RNA Complex, archaeal, ribosomal, 50S, protein.0A [Caudoviricetes sp.]